MKSIVTLTLNPAIDGSCDADLVRPTRKVRTTNERYDPGGGGINVARIVKRLGGRVHAFYLGGGATGAVLSSLLDRDGISRTCFDIAGHTRISHSVFERSTGLEYRFVPEGPLVSEPEWQACFQALASLRCDYLVLSGSLPRGIADDCYARLARIMHARGTLLVLDTSGAALRRTLAGGNIFLVKPSRGELEQLAGRTLPSDESIAEVASGIIRSGQAKYVAVTLGHHGALLASADTTERLPAIKVKTRSAVGAGDSFLGAMTFGLAQGLDVGAAFRLGIAAGAATAMTPGTGLCDLADIDRLTEVVARRRRRTT
ncbi:1-phosphofructokinase family hexose kinase [Sphingomonas sp. LaA6.9]|uniref:1-phosphofructokinase family hexose kinase n=1 Tax=Sphingomonas sp. LaA6.9 TaxID=2919914 RepID=UPI001F4FE195|nr:1-phosphofructokinase family hexose kinase [Sphingomonas sp. LaA6.9]MCJ8156850.1 1-phosphofructokinase family hexose kinase [Sphingomonas sp. LaA6.9]